MASNLLERQLNAATQGLKNAGALKPATDTNAQKRQQLKVATTMGAVGRSVQNSTAAPATKSLDTNTLRGTLGEIERIRSSDPDKAQSVFDKVMQLQQNPASRYYNPFSQPTNRAVSALQQTWGVDTSQLTSDWFKQNTAWQADLIRNGTTNSPSKPGKRAPQAQKFAYDLFQYQQGESLTEQAERELEQLNNWCSYWSTQSDRNWSDEDIISKINWKDYPALKSARESVQSGKLPEFNRPIACTDDDLMGVIWAARNGGGTGDHYADMANSALGTGNVWKADSANAARLEYGNPDYAPYTVGCTMDKERVRFNRSTFDQKWVDDNASIMNTGTQEEQDAYLSVKEGVENAAQAKKELENLKTALDKRIANARSVEDAMAKLDILLESGDYPTLAKMDATAAKGLGHLMKMGESVQYSKGLMQQYIQDGWNKRADSEEDEIAYTDNVIQAAVGSGVQLASGIAPQSATQAVNQKPIEEPGYPDDALGPNDTALMPGGALVLDASNASQKSTEQEDPIGQFGAGNIDLDNRKVYTNPDGSFSTERSFSVEIDGKEVLLPSIIDGKPVSQDEAIKHYDETGEYLGKFDSVEEADAYAEALHERQERKYGAAAPAPVAPAPAAPVDVMTEQEKEVVRQQDQTLSDGIDMADKVLTSGESEYLESSGSMMTDFMTNAMTQIKDGAIEFTKNVARANQKKIQQNHVDSVLGSLQVAYDYERNGELLQTLRFREGELAAEVAGKEYVGQQVEQTLTVPLTRGERTFQAVLNWGGDGYRLVGIDELTNGDPAGVGNREDWELALGDGNEVDSFVEEANQKAATIQQQNEEYANLSDEEKDKIRTLQAIRLQIEDAETYEREHQAEYAKAQEDFKKDQEAVRDALYMNKALGLDTSDVERLEVAVGYLTQFHDYEATVWSKYNPSQMYANALAMGADINEVRTAAKKGNDELAGELELAQTIKAYLKETGLKVPDSYTQNLDRHIAKLQRDMEDYSYFELRFNDDFEEIAQKGRQMEYDSRPQSWSLFHNPQDDWDIDQYYAYQENGVYDESGRFDDHGLKGLLGGMNSLMDKGELDTYYYLLGSGQEKKAQEYAAYMADMTYGVLWTRRREKTEKEARGIVDSGLGGFLGGNALAVIMSPVSAIMSLGYYGYNFVTGSEMNPDNGMLITSHFRNATREESAQEIQRFCVERGYGENSWQQKVMQAGYEIVTNRADSAMNALVFGGLFGEASKDAGFLEKAGKEFLGALPMGISASMDAAAEAKRKGASDAQAYGVAAITLFAETATEAISLDNIRDAFKAGEDISSGTIKEFLKNWLTKAGLSEAFGEAVNDIIENFADEKIMGSLSDHSDRVWEYRMNGLTPEEAEAAARRDELNGVLRTAMISYLSPGLDIISTAAGRVDYYRKVTQLHQEAGDNRSMLEIMRGEKKAVEALENAGAEIGADPSQKALVSSYEILENAKKGAKAAQTSAVAAALSGVEEKRGSTARAIANAAAVRLGRVFGKDSVVDGVQKLVTGAAVGKVNADALNAALQNAALSKNSAAAQMMGSLEFKQATPEQQAAMLAGTVAADAGNTTVMNDIIGAVREHRINERTKAAIANGALESVRPAVKAANEAARESRVAEGQLEDRQEATKAAQDAVAAAGEEIQRDPQAGAPMMNEALNKLQSTAAVEAEYEQKADTAHRKEQNAKDEADQAVNQRMSEVRQEATAEVRQMEADEAQQAELDAELKQRQLEEEKAAAEAKEASDNALDADAEQFIEENYPDATDEEKARIRELFEQNRSETSIPEEDRAKFLKSVGKKFGINIVEADETEYNANGSYDRGTNTLTLNKKATAGDALFFVLGHELTHVTEKAGDYGKLADSILRVAFGDGVTYQGILDAMQRGDNGSPLARMVNARRATYEKSANQGTHYGNDYYLQEIVADNLGLILRGDPANPQAQQDLINRLVQDDPKMGRKILDGIKSFLKKAVGMRGAWQTDMQNTVDLFTQALENVQKNVAPELKPTEQSPTVGQLPEQQTVPKTPQEAIQKAAETGEAQPLPDRKGNETPAEVLRGGTVSLSPDLIAQSVAASQEFTDNPRLSLNSFNEAEQERTRAALLAAKDSQDRRLFTAEQVDQYIKDALGVASIIAGDRARLDFKATDNPLMTFLKKNQDYGFTLDASTLCAKRLLYQGTFNYVQHAMPDEVFTPADLVDLVNIMNEMGYETPCGICYVESRRRWLDTYAHEFIDTTLANPEPFISKQFKKASAEEKAALLERLNGEKPSIDDLTTTDGLEKLRKNDPYMYKAFVAAMNAKGSANPKIVQPRAEYKGEIAKLTKKQIQALKDIGGLRIQSFSDFETPHLLDMMQAVMDMAARGLTSQAYTKVPNFAWVFGDTGIKINLSLIGKGTGLDDNGNLIFDNKEGINFDEAMQLRNRYSQNVGTILVGINDDHIIAAMGDPRIDFIIPFHKSGWSDLERKGIKSLQYYEDYTDTQNERKLYKDENGNLVKNEDGSYKTVPAKESKLVNFEPVGAHAYWDFSKNGEWNARKYLKMCAEDGRIPKFNQFLVDNGDGSFSLPEGDDKRSKSIREGYWKTLIDFKMYDNDGNGAAQQEVTPNINMPQARWVLNNYSLNRPSGNPDTKMADMKSNNDVPVATTAAEEFIRRIREKRAGKTPPENPNDPLHATAPKEINVMALGRSQFADDDVAAAPITGTAASAAMAEGAAPVLGNAEAEQNESTLPPAQQRMAIDAETGENVRYSLPSEDVQEAAEKAFLNSKVRTSDGKLMPVYHGTKADFNVFDTSVSGGSNGAAEGFGIYLTDNPEVSEAYGDRQISAYVNMERPARSDKKTIKKSELVKLIKAACEKEAQSFVDEGSYGSVSEALPDTWISNYVYTPDYRTIQDAYKAVADSILSMNDNDMDIVQEIMAGMGIRDYGRAMDFYHEVLTPTTGIDGFWTTWKDAQTGATSNVMLAFDSSQIKSNEDVTYDDRGNPIPLSERFNTSNPDIRYSLPQDAPYMAAVERGEMDQAQQMVDEKAQEAGYVGAFQLDNTRYSLPELEQEYAEATREGNEDWQRQVVQQAAYNAGYTTGAYHGSPETNITEFNTRSVETKKQKLQLLFGTHFTQDRSFADIYARKAKNSKGTSRLTSKTGKVYDVYLNLGKSLDLKTAKNYTPDTEMYQLYNDLPANIQKKHKPFTFSAYDTEQGLGSGEYITARHMEDALQDMSPKDATEFLVDHGYNSVQYLANYNTGMSNNRFGRDPSIIMLDPEKIKSADPVTYDDQGNPIPLSERFNQESPDIRYQLPDNAVLEQQIREYLAGGGSLSQNTAQANTMPGMPVTPGGPQRQFGSQTAQTSDALHEQVRDYLRNNSDYDPDSNRAQIGRAIGWVQSLASEGDPDGYAAALNAVDSPDFDYRSADGQARMLTLMSMAALKAESGDQRALNDELRLADTFNRQGTDLGQALQSRKIFRLMTPLGRQATLKKEADKINENFKRQGKSTRVQLSNELLIEAGNAKTPKEFEAVRKKAAKELAAQMPSNWKDKLTALRMLSMLGNPRTHVRNILGNAIFMPAVGLKNKIGAVAEIATRQKTRTKTLGLASKEARTFAKADAKEMEAVLRGEETKYKDGNAVEQERKAFGQGRGLVSRTVGKAMQWLVDANGNALEAEDWIFLQRHYRNALAGYMTANKLTAKDMKGATLDAARAYAVQEAQKATYRDANRVIEGLNKFEQSHPGVKFVGNAILPFKKTPANILKRGVEYSPVGLINALTRGAKQVRSGQITPTQFIDKLASGLTGTGIMALGAILSQMGAATAGLGDDDDEFEKLKGNQAYAINPGKVGNTVLQAFGAPKLFGEDVSYTVDWAAPACMPFFVGAAIMDTYENRENLDWAGVLNDIMGITEPVFNLSMLDGVNSLLDVSQYAEGTPITQIGEKVVTNYLTSYIPSAVGAYTRAFVDTTRRKSYVESGADLSTFRYAIEQAENKLPWLSTTNIPYRDVWGNPDTSGTAEAILENFLSPGYANQIKNDPVVNELERIYRETGNPNMVPKAASKTIGTTKLNAEQYDQYVVSRGQTAHQVLTDLMESPFWAICDDPTRAKMVEDAWTYANQIGQHDVTGKKLESWVLDATTSGDVVTSIVSRTADSNRKDYISGFGTALAIALDEDNGEDYGISLAALDRAEATNVEIRNSLRTYFKPLYQNAYLNGDTDTMDEIKEKLIDLDIGFKAKDFTGWVPDTEEEETDTSWLNPSKR